MIQLKDDIFHTIFEHLGYLDLDQNTLHSLLFVNRSWCRFFVKLLWETPFFESYNTHKIINTLVACLPDESRDYLRKNEIHIETPISKPIFKYVSYVKMISIPKINEIIIRCKLNDNKKILLLQRTIVEMFMKDTSSLTSLECDYDVLNMFNYPGAENFSNRLSELSCSSATKSLEMFPKCFHNIRTLTITFKDPISNGVKNLIIHSQNLTHLILIQHCKFYIDWTDIIPALKERSTTLTRLQLYLPGPTNISILFMSEFKNLQEIHIAAFRKDIFDDNFENIKFTTSLRLKFSLLTPKNEILNKLLKRNEASIQEICMCDDDRPLNSLNYHFPVIRTIPCNVTNEEKRIIKNILNDDDMEDMKAEVAKDLVKVKTLKEMFSTRFQDGLP